MLDPRTVAIPERPGNLRADTFRNVLQQPRVGLIFLVVGKEETLRFSGTARIAGDGWLRERLAVQGRLPELALVVTVEEPFMYCTKCMVRSQMWQSQLEAGRAPPRSERRWLFMVIWTYRFGNAPLQKTMSASDCTDY